MRSSAYRRTGAALAASVLVLSLLPSASVQAEEVSEWRTPLTRVAQPTQVVAASGDSVLAWVHHAYRLSTDGGTSWREVDPGLDPWFAGTADFVEDGHAAVATDEGVTVVDLATGTGTTASLAPLALAAAAQPVAATSDRDALLRDGDRVVVSHLEGGSFGPPAAVGSQDLPTPSASVSQEIGWSIDHHFGYRTVIHRTRGAKVTATDIDPFALDGGAGPSAFRVTGSLLHLRALDGTRLEYVTRSGTAVSRCVRDVARGTSSCRLLRRVPTSHAPVIVQKQGTVLLLQDRKAWYACDTASGGCTLKSIPLKGRVLSTQYDAVGDPTRPLVSVAAGGLDPFYAVAPGPVLVKRFDPLVAKASVVGLSMGVNRLVGWDDRLGGAVWQRPLGDGIGAEKRLADRAEAALASAGRTAVATASGVAFYDRSTAVSRGSAVNALLGFSGPYALLDRGSGWFDLTGYAGVPMGSYVRAPGHVRAIFGTRVLGGTDCLQGSAMCTGSGDGETTLVVTDLLDATYRRPIPLPDGVDARTSHVQAAFLWGDRVAASFTSADPDTGETTVRSAVYDLVVGTWGDLQDARLLGLGDGYAVREDGDGLSAWDYATGETYRLSDTDGGAPVTAGADTLAYATDDEIVVRRVPGAGTSAPRVLGVVAPAGCNAWDCAWSPQFDLTKALDAGQVVIRDPQGEVVRTLRTAATTDGSVRGVTWDGRSDTGAFVAAGDYRWQLVVAAADGSGTATGVDGTSVPGGTIAVTRTHLGTVALSKVAVSDTTPAVDQELTADVVLRPADADLTYTWYSGSAVVSTGAGEAYASYRVQPTDLGRRLKVVVSAEREGTYPATRGSARTKPVAAARFTDVAAPVLTVDGNSVRATVPDWAPAATLALQWYRLVPGRASVKIGAGLDYTLLAADNGARLKLVVTGSRPGYRTATASATTEAVSFVP